ncbi:MAG: helix-turn-helix domain-containing protein [Bacteroidetes bacterium]|nr:helix-turn-helix domain-containing protein [Bacteroidota bacterium]
MELIVIDSEAFQQLKIDMKMMIKQAVTEAKFELLKKQEDDLVSWEEAKKILPYKSKSSWQEFRDSGKIKFEQIGRKIMYSKKSLIEFLKQKNKF